MEGNRRLFNPQMGGTKIPQHPSILSELMGFGTSEDTYDISHLMRYKDQLDTFRYLIRHKIAPKGGDCVVFSFGCAHGQEASSIAAVALDEMGKVKAQTVNLSIIGIDNDPSSLETARRKLFTGFDMRDRSTPEDVEFVNSRLEGIRRVVEFRSGDISNPRSISGLEKADAVFLNAMLFHAFKSREVDEFSLFRERFTDIIKPNAVIFTTDPFLIGNERFVQQELSGKSLVQQDLIRSYMYVKR